MSTKAKLGIVGLVVLFVIIMDYAPRRNDPAPEASAPEASTPSHAGERLQNVAAAEVALQESMRNPESLVIEQRKANESGSVVCFVYRAQNGFGGMNQGAAYVADNKLRLNPPVSVFNKVCAVATFDAF
jgi:hypothetical protein